MATTVICLSAKQWCEITGVGIKKHIISGDIAPGKAWEEPTTKIYYKNKTDKNLRFSIGVISVNSVGTIVEDKIIGTNNQKRIHSNHNQS